MPPRGPEHGERPALGRSVLGRSVLDWMRAHLAPPGQDAPGPFALTEEQTRFLLAHFEPDPVTGRRIIRRVVLARPRGWAMPAGGGGGQERGGGA
ncbi:hypothetical protein [Streptomyces sp. CAU 1734]|uniref:hypothetical protein n=1 Tax=Streptomyces sp. CAU 1734 TaxID=3140360 RepID=UPI0032611941